MYAFASPFAKPSFVPTLDSRDKIRKGNALFYPQVATYEAIADYSDIVHAVLKGKRISACLCSPLAVFIVQDIELPGTLLNNRKLKQQIKLFVWYRTVCCCCSAHYVPGMPLTSSEYTTLRPRAMCSPCFGSSQYGF